MSNAIVCGRILEASCENNAHRVDVQEVRWTSWRRTDQRKCCISREFGDYFTQDEQAAVVHLFG